ncbi:MAG TPA: hypothetical protein VK571_08595 [Gemmatimonadaceae bacterium]|nr:hypothetical protein [Gemmatimonadaceae bacterium]
MKRTTARTRALSSALLLSAALLACGKKNDTTLTDTTSLGTTTATVAMDTTPVRVSDIQVGKAIGTDKKISNQTTDFGVRDTIYVSVVTDGAAKDAALSTGLTFNGKAAGSPIVSTISPAGGTTATEFHFAKKSAWPKGKYNVVVLLNGASGGTKEIEVK